MPNPCPRPTAVWIGPGRAPLAACCKAHYGQPVTFVYRDDVKRDNR